jgi:hypothetical protein
MVHVYAPRWTHARELGALIILNSTQAGVIDRFGGSGTPLVGLLDNLPHSSPMRRRLR